MERQTIVVDGFSKTYGVTGWRLGFVHGPAAIIDKLTMLQQYTFVCAPHPLQWAAVAALDVDMSEHIDAYRRKRDLVVAGLAEAGYSVVKPGGAFYVFPEVPQSTGGASGTRRRASEFVARAIENELLDHPRQHLQRPRHALPHLLRGQRRDDRARARGAAVHLRSKKPSAVGRGFVCMRKPSRNGWAIMLRSRQYALFVCGCSNSGFLPWTMSSVIT